MADQSSSPYAGIHSSFKAYLLGKDNAAELPFFKLFVNDLIDKAILDTRLSLDVSTNNVITRSAHYRTLTKIFKGSMIVSQSENSHIEIQYRSVIPGFIELRNRYFHFMSGNPNNLTGTDLMDSDEFFSVVNCGFANWLCYVYFRILEARVS